MKTLALNQLFQWLLDIQAEGKASLARGYDPVCLFANFNSIKLNVNVIALPSCGWCLCLSFTPPHEENLKP